MPPRESAPKRAPDRLSKLVIGVPTVRRPRDYVLETVDSLLAGIPPEARHRVEIVVLNAEQPPARHAAVDRLTARHAEAVASGLLRVIENRPGHPELGDRPSYSPEMEDGARLSAWRAKQTLDCALLMEACAGRGSHYLHLEDDVRAADHLWERLAAWYAPFAERDDWFALALYSPFGLPDGAAYPVPFFYGFMGVLLRAADLPIVIAWLRRRFAEGPVDHLFRDLLVATDRRMYLRSPSLFEHVGMVSSLPGRRSYFHAARFAESRPAKLVRLLVEGAEVLGERPRGITSFLWQRWLEDRVPPSVRTFVRRLRAALPW